LHGWIDRDVHAGNGLIVGNTIEHMPVGLLERYCPLAKFEYSAVTPVN
jgi:hypothetical protein